MPRRRPQRKSQHRVSFWGSPEVDALQLHMAAMERFFVGANYFAKFEARAFALPSTALPLAEAVLLACPEARPDLAPVKIISSKDMVEELTQCLSLRFCTSPKEQEATWEREQWMREEFWRLLEACIDFESSTILSYLGRDGLPPYDVFWHFALLIHSPLRQRCLFLIGGASD